MLSGLVSKVFPDDQVVDESVKLGEKIGALSKLAVAIAREAVNQSQELPLSEGLKFERRVFQSSFATVWHSCNNYCLSCLLTCIY